MEVSNPVVAANKIDAVKDREATLNGIAERLKLELPWHKSGLIVPTSAKNGELDELKKKLKKILIENGRSDLLGVFK
jgi:GTP-binding protein EngB required for normal cell division